MKNIEKITIENKYVLLLNFAVLCFISGDYLAQFRGANLTVWDYSLLILTDHYYIFYALIPIVFIVLAKQLRGIRDIEIIRFKDVFQYRRFSVRRFLSWMALYLLSQLIITLAVGASQFSFRIYDPIRPSPDAGEWVLLLNLYKTYFGNAIFSLLACLAYMLFGFAVFIYLLEYVNHRFSYRKAIIFSGVVYLLALLGFRTELKNFIPILSFNNFIVLHHVLASRASSNFLLVVLSGILVIGYYSGRRFGLASQDGFEAFVISRKERVNSYLLLVTLLTIGLLRPIHAGDFSPREILVSMMMGTSQNNITFLSWLSISLLYIIPLFTIAHAHSRVYHQRKEMLLVRSESVNAFERSLIKTSLRYIARYWLVLLLLTNSIYWLGEFIGDEVELLAPFHGEFRQIDLNVYLLFFLGSLLLDFILFRLLSRKLREVIGFLLVLLSKFLLLSFPRLHYLCINFGMLSYFEGGESPASMALKGFIIGGLIAIYLTYIFIRRSSHARPSN